MASTENLRYFQNHEFPSGALAHMSPYFLHVMDAWRHSLGRGNTVKLNPRQDAWIRLTGSKSSRHYCIGRLSDAGDVFPNCNHRLAWLKACKMPEIGGIGIYYDVKLDGRPKVMLHLDTRPERVLWARVNGNYIYPERSEAEAKLFFQRLEKDEPWNT